MSLPSQSEIETKYKMSEKPPFPEFDNPEIMENSIANSKNYQKSNIANNNSNLNNQPPQQSIKETGYDSAPISQSGYNSAPVNQSGYNSAPVGQPGYNSKPVGQSGYNSAPVGQPGYNSNPVGQPGNNSIPVGQPGYIPIRVPVGVPLGVPVGVPRVMPIYPPTVYPAYPYPVPNPTVTVIPPGYQPDYTGVYSPLGNIADDLDNLF